MAGTGSMTDDAGTVPYGSYAVFKNFLNGLREGVPHQIDRTVLATQSGSTQGFIMRTLRFFRLIDQYGNAEDELARLATAADGQRQSILREILTRSYPELLDDPSFRLSTATDQMLRRKLELYGLRGDTVNKARAFFLHAVEDAGIEVSRFIKVKASPAKPRGRPRTRVRTNGDDDRPEETTVATTAPQLATQQAAPSPHAERWFLQLQGILAFLPTDRQWTSEQRLRWFGMLESTIDYLIEVTSGDQPPEPAPVGRMAEDDIPF